MPGPHTQLADIFGLSGNNRNSGQDLSALLAQVESVHLLPYPHVDWGVLGVVGDDQRSSKFPPVLLVIVLSVSLENEITSVQFQYFFKLDFNDLFRVFLVHELFSQIFKMNFSPIIS